MFDLSFDISALLSRTCATHRKTRANRNYATRRVRRHVAVRRTGQRVRPPGQGVRPTGR
jgi:hypothetical protein